MKKKVRLFSLTALYSISLLLLTSCQKNMAPDLWMYIIDVSDSAQEEDFLSSAKKTCQSMAQSTEYGDLYAPITVSHDIPEYTQPFQIVSNDYVYRSCQILGEAEPQKKSGTFPCKAWRRSLRLVNKYAEGYRPIVISQIHANEHEEKCDDLLIDLAKSIQDRNGIFIHSSSSNDGETGYNKWLVDLLLDEFDNVHFVEALDSIQIDKFIKKAEFEVAENSTEN